MPCAAASATAAAELRRVHAAGGSAAADVGRVVSSWLHDSCRFCTAAVVYPAFVALHFRRLWHTAQQSSTSQLTAQQHAPALRPGGVAWVRVLVAAAGAVAAVLCPAAAAADVAATTTSACYPAD